MIVLIVIILRLLPNRIRRISKNNPYIRLRQRFKPLVVFTECRLEDVGVAVVGKGVRPEHDVVGRVGLARAELVEDPLEVHRGDVVGERDDFVPVQLGRELLRELVLRDEAALHETREEGPRSRERVEDVHPVVVEVRAELLLHEVRHRAVDEVHHLDRRIDDAELFLKLRESRFEELLEEVLDDGLALGRGLDVAHADLHRLVEVLEGASRRAHPVLVERIDHRGHRPGDRVVFREFVDDVPRVVADRKERVEDRLRHDVLSEHVDDFFVRKLAVQRRLQFLLEALERRAGRFAFAEDLLDVSDLLFAEEAHVLSPVAPLTSIADALQDTAADVLLEHFVAFKEAPLASGVGRAFGLRPSFAFRTGCAGDLRFFVELLFREAHDLDLVRVDLAELRVHRRTELVVDRLQGPEHLPNDVEFLIVVQSIFAREPGRRHDGEDDVTALLTRVGRDAHDAAHGLNDLDLRLAGRKKEHRVERRHVDPFRKATHIEENLAAVLGGLLAQPVEKRRFFGGVHRPVDMLAVALEGILGRVSSPTVGRVLGVQREEVFLLEGFDDVFEVRRKEL